MPVKPEILHKYNSAQQQLWQSVTKAVSEVAGYPVSFGDPVSHFVPVSDLYAEMATPRLVIQFAFAHDPDNLQVLLADDTVVSDIYESFTGSKSGIIDDAKVSELRQLWEAVVQGVCLAAGQLKSESVVATNLSIRYQIFGFPPNMQRADELFKTTVVYQNESMTGQLLWIADRQSAFSLMNLSADDLDTPALATGTAKHASISGPEVAEDSQLDILLDIPLEITVELGRLKMVVRDVVELGTGSIVELDKAAGEPVDVLVNGRLVARGEVVVIEDNFGVRITEIITLSERLASLRDAS